MKKEVLVITSFSALGIIAAFLILRKRNKSNPVQNKKTNKIIVKTPYRPYELKNRYKFLDEWIAEEGGAESIREMYKKRPSAFPSSDVAYLKSKGVLTGEQNKGRGLTIQNIV